MASPGVEFEFDPDWKNAIGRYLVAFGEFERWTHRCISELCSPRVAAEARRLSWAPRARFARAALLDSGQFDHALLDEIFEGLQPLTKLRNLLAHNPPEWSFRTGGEADSQEWQIVTELVNAQNLGQSATLEQIKEMTVEAERLHGKLLVISRELALRELRRAQGRTPA